RCTLNQVIALLTHKGAEICKLDAGTLSPGAKADICLIDPDEAWTVDANKFFSKARNCPWNGQRLKGTVKATYVAGQQVFDGRKITA
ncbi:MAG TPA: dihydroorotase, partial [Opitutae bacterium]|nr:dihydroorotase [Opitutae bacterium]